MANLRFLRLVKILSGVQSDAEIESGRVEHFAHFCVLVGRSFVRNRCLIRASALSYSTLLALIPLLAVAISVTSSLLKTQGEAEIYTAIDKFVANVMPLGNRENDTARNFSGLTNSVAGTNSIAATTNNSAEDERVVNAQKNLAQGIHDFVQNTQSKTLGAVGIMLLIYVAIMMLANIEATFNDIWGVTRGRPWLNRIVLYWTTITLGPLLIAGALMLTGSSHFQSTKNLVGGTVVGSFIFLLLPVFVLWFVFAMIYRLVPHTKVNFSAALVGGIVGGSLWHLNNLFGFLYVSRFVTNSHIYGKLGIVPVFMAGIYLSWVILLFGAQVAYAFQNRRAYLQDKLVENVNQRGREFIALRLMTCIGQRFQHGEPPVTLEQISVELEIPTKLAQQVLQPLLAAHIVIEVGGTATAYTPARPLDAITAHHVLHAMRTGGGQELPLRDGPVRAEVLGEFARIEEAEQLAASSITMLALVNRAQTKLELAAPATDGKIP
jgi:membrane protein